MPYESDFYIVRSKREDKKEISGELELPDYLPNIKKVLLCREHISLPECDISGQSASAEGVAACKIIYSSDDGRLYSSSLDIEYSFSFPLEAPIKDAVPCISVFSEGTTVKAVSSRKVGIKLKLGAVCLIQSPSEDRECIVEEGVPSECQALCKQYEYMQVKISESGIIELADEIVGEGNEETRIIACESTPLVTDIEWSDGKINVRGEVTSEILMCDDSSPEVPRLIKRKTPFSYTGEQEVEKISDFTYADLTVASNDVRTEGNRILLNICCAIKIKIFIPCQKNICVDIFSPANKLVSNEGSVELCTPVLCLNRNMSINTSLPSSDAGIDKNQKLVCSFASAYNAVIVWDEESGRSGISGDAVFKIITVNDNNEVPEYDCKEVILPFKYDVTREMGDIGDKKDCILFPMLSAFRTFSRFDGERIGLDTELALSFSIIGKRRINCICSISDGEKILSDKSRIRIVYPMSGESLWSLCKRTYSASEALVSANKIAYEGEIDSPKSLEGIKYLII